MPVEVLGTWPTIVGIEDKEEEWQKREGWNMVEKEEREILNT